MIRLFDLSATSSREINAAEAIRSALLQSYPQADARADFQIDLVPNILCPGQTYSEMDILLVATFPPGTTWQPSRSFTDSWGEPFDAEEIELRSVVLTIEVKDHPADKVQFHGNAVHVLYNDTGWHNASLQAATQPKCLASFVKGTELRPPMVRGVLWLRGIAPHQFPNPIKGVLGSALTWSNLLQTALDVSPPTYDHEIDGYVVDAFAPFHANAAPPDKPGDFLALFTHRAYATELDRLRVERLGSDRVKEAMTTTGLGAYLGERMVLLRGAGGTGKTVTLLQIARHLYDTQDARVLILTYNTALVGELFRLLGLLRAQEQIEADRLLVRTVHSYMGELCAWLCGDAPVTLENDDESTYERRYDAQKSAALQVLKGATERPADPDEIARFDYVLIDEGQDFPQDERDLLVQVFGHQNLVIAEGSGQFSRPGGKRTDWRDKLTKDKIYVHPLERCLRQKANIARFVERFAQEFNVADYKIAPPPNDALPGGRVIIIEGDYFSNPDRHRTLMEANRSAHNCAMDFLFCVPPSLVSGGNSGATKESIAAMALGEWEYATWDGANPATRRTIPADPDAFRVITYDSCRGLEGWTGVLLALDDFHAHKLALTPEGSDRTPEESAALWCVVALLRAMDTLVITVSESESPVKRALHEMLPACRDFMEWHKNV
jgi:hypothetical protein